MLALHRGPDVRLWSRAERPLGGYFPEITRLVPASLPPGVVLDGELVVWQRERTSFALLQRRLTAGRQVPRMAREHPAHYVIFDLIADPHGDLLDAPLAERRRRLAALLDGAPGPAHPVPANDRTGPGPAVADRMDRGRHRRRGGQTARRALPTPAAAAGASCGPAAPPRRSSAASPAPSPTPKRSCWAASTPPGDCATPAEATHSPQHAAATWPGCWNRPGAGAAARRTHPWPQPLPAAWSGQFRQPQPLPYIQVQPTVVAQIEVDTAYEHHRWRHPVRYLQYRQDLSVYDVPLLPP